MKRVQVCVQSGVQLAHCLVLGDFGAEIKIWFCHPGFGNGYDLRANLKLRPGAQLAFKIETKDIMILTDRLQLELLMRGRM